MRGEVAGLDSLLRFDGDSFVIDLAPGELGMPGQVFYRPNVPDLGAPAAASLGAFLKRVNRIIEEGRYEVVFASIIAEELY